MTNRQAIIQHLLFVAIFLCSIITFSCSNAQQKTAETIDSDHIIDSLIVVKKVNDKAILLLFGSDAVTAVNTNEGIVVIDAGISTSLTSKFRRIIENEFQSNDFAYVINSHSHPDHNGGNSVFHEAKIIGQEDGLEEISQQRANPGNTKKRIAGIVEDYELKLQEREINTEAWYDAFTQKMRYYFALKDAEMKIPIKQPELTFSDSLQIDMGDVKFQMHHFGKCHSNSDIMIYIPEMKILFTGDLFSSFGRPAIRDTSVKDVEKWKTAIQWNEKRIPGIETIISGHGAFLSIEDLEYFNTRMMEIGLN